MQAVVKICRMPPVSGGATCPLCNHWIEGIRPDSARSDLFDLQDTREAIHPVRLIAVSDCFLVENDEAITLRYIHACFLCPCTSRPPLRVLD